jgi:hypothetical protein
MAGGKSARDDCTRVPAKLHAFFVACESNRVWRREAGDLTRLESYATVNHRGFLVA